MCVVGYLVKLQQHAVAQKEFKYMVVGKALELLGSSNRGRPLQFARKTRQMEAEFGVRQEILVQSRQPGRWQEKVIYYSVPVQEVTFQAKE